METVQDIMTQTMACGRRVPQIGDVYHHFKGIDVVIENIAVHTEDRIALVIYRHGDDVWARPLTMFLSKVDKDKYPDCNQEYRFERKLPWDVTNTVTFRQLIDVLQSCPDYQNYTKQELTNYAIQHYYI